MVTYTTTYNLKKPTVADDEDVWGGYLNDSMDLIDDVLDGTTPVTGIDINSGTIDNAVIGGTTPVAGTFTALTANTSLGVTGNITVSGTVDGRDVAADGTKLDGIESGAEVNVATNLGNAHTSSNVQITSSTGTNTVINAASTSFAGVMLPTDKSKLDGIESGATADQTKADIDALGINADLVDGVHGTSFLRNDTNNSYIQSVGRSTSWGVTNGTSTGALNAVMGTSSGATYLISGTSNGTFRAGWQVLDSGGSMRFQLGSNSYTLDGSGGEIWHSGNDGSGSGLDADTVDGYQTSTVQSTNTVAVRDSSGYLFAQYFNGNGTFSTSGASSGMVNFTGTNGSDTYGRSYNGTAARAAMGLSTTSGVTFGSVTGTSWVYSPGYIQAPTMYLNGALYHTGDTDTYFAFGTNTITLATGGTTVGVNTSGVFINDGSLAEDYDALSGTSVTCNVDNAGAFSLSMTGNTTFTFTGAGSGYSQGFVLQLTGNGSTVTWPTSVDWAGGTAPDAPASGETDIYVFWTRDGGTTWYGVQSIDAAA